MRSIVLLRAAILAGVVLAGSALDTVFADTVVVSADRMVDVLTGRVVDHPQITITDGRISAVGSQGAAAPADARPAALRKADLVTAANGGNGAVRELVDLILAGEIPLRRRQTA